MCAEIGKAIGTCGGQSPRSRQQQTHHISTMTICMCRQHQQAGVKDSASAKHLLKASNENILLKACTSLVWGKMQMEVPVEVSPEPDIGRTDNCTEVELVCALGLISRLTLRSLSAHSRLNQQ